LFRCALGTRLESSGCEHPALIQSRGHKQAAHFPFSVPRAALMHACLAHTDSVVCVPCCAGRHAGNVCPTAGFGFLHSEGPEPDIVAVGVQGTVRPQWTPAALLPPHPLTWPLRTMLVTNAVVNVLIASVAMPRTPHHEPCTLLIIDLVLSNSCCICCVVVASSVHPQRPCTRQEKGLSTWRWTYFSLFTSNWAKTK
jgi:hypothetical protein